MTIHNNSISIEHPCPPRHDMRRYHSEPRYLEEEADAKDPDQDSGDDPYFRPVFEGDNGKESEKRDCDRQNSGGNNPEIIGDRNSEGIIEESCDCSGCVYNESEYLPRTFHTAHPGADPSPSLILESCPIEENCQHEDSNGREADENEFTPISRKHLPLLPCLDSPPKGRIMPFCP